MNSRRVIFTITVVGEAPADMTESQLGDFTQAIEGEVWEPFACWMTGLTVHAEYHRAGDIVVPEAPQRERLTDIAPAPTASTLRARAAQEEARL